MPTGIVGGRMATARKSFVSQKLRRLERRLLVADHHRHDRALRLRQAGESRKSFRLVQRQRGVSRLALDQVERRDGGGDAGRRQAGRIDQRAGAVADQIDHRRRGAQITAIGADRLRQRAHLQRDRNMRVARVTGAATAADHADAVRVVGHQPGVEIAGELVQLRQRREIAVHREHAVGDDQRMVVFGAMLAQQRAGMTDVIVAEAHDLGVRQLRAGEQAGVRQLVGQHQAVAADQRRDDAGIGEIAGAEHDRGLRLFEAGEPALKLGVKRVIAGDQARGAGAGAVFFDRRDGGLLDGGMLGQVQIVVAGERQQPLAVALDPDAVLAHGLGQSPPQVAALQVVELALGELVE